MRLSFMSWVCPGWDIEEIARFGAESPYDGVELRVNSDHAHGLSYESSMEEREYVRELLASRGLELPCIATSHQLTNAASDGEELTDAKADVKLAADVGARYIRVFAGGGERSLTASTSEQVAQALTTLGEFSRGYGVSPLLEVKHDMIETADDAAEILDRVQTSNVGLLWNQSTISRSSVERLGDRINHIHVHEDVLDPQNDDVESLARRLQRVGYDGYISLEIIRGKNIPPENLTKTGERLSGQIELNAD